MTFIPEKKLAIKPLSLFKSKRICIEFISSIKTRLYLSQATLIPGLVWVLSFLLFRCLLTKVFSQKLPCQEILTKNFSEHEFLVLASVLLPAPTGEKNKKMRDSLLMQNPVNSGSNFVTVLRDSLCTLCLLVNPRSWEDQNQTST